MYFSNSKKRKLEILLITNCDSENLGDQVIEACDISLIHTAMKNLGFSESNYNITSKPASIIKKRYVETQKRSLLRSAKRRIKNSDIIIFGGAPMFNFRYQIFYERTALIIEMAEKYGKPVAFSAIGIEQYEENNAKCQRLKQALNLDCVKQITTRDGIDELHQFKVREDLPIGKVADPAVFTNIVFNKYISSPSVTQQSDGEIRKKKIELFIMREDAFTDNGIDFDYKNTIRLWLGVIKELKNRGYDYELITSGHVTDEAFMDYLIRQYHVSRKKCCFNMNSPEQLIEKISQADAVFSTRLHPSIISYSLGVPSVGLVWNNKVTRFYENIGNTDRIVQVLEANPQMIVDKLEKAMNEGVSRDPNFMITVYESMFNALRRCLESINVPYRWKPHAEPYDLDTVIKKLPPFVEPTKEQMNVKLLRKFRRIYGEYNKKIDELRSYNNDEYKLYYHSKYKGDIVQPIQEKVDVVDGTLIRLPSGALEIKLKKPVDSSNPQSFIECPYTNTGFCFKGWELRLRLADQWYWYLEDGSIVKAEYKERAHDKLKCFQVGERLPVFDGIVNTVVAEAVWENVG